MKKMIIAAQITILGLVSTLHAETLKVDAEIKPYQKVSGVSGELNSIGSDTLNNLMTFWAEGFRAIYPNVKIQIEGKGSSTAPPALASGTAQLGPMSRPMKNEELEKFEAKFGFKPSKVGVSLDALAVYVHKDNPITSLSLEQVDAIFSKTRARGASSDINTWGQLGMKGKDWDTTTISMYGRNSASGTYGYFKEHALGKGDFKDNVKEQPGSATVVQGVSKELSAMGYSGLGYKTPDVKALQLSNKNGEPAFAAEYANVLSGKYPLSRMLYVYYIKDPKKTPDKLVTEFLKFTLSKEGQEIVIKDGYLPLPAKVVASKLAEIENKAAMAQK